MIVDLYTLKPLPLEIRTTFELVAWPYGEHFEVFKKQMQSLFVFRYEDTEMEDGGKDINFPINFELDRKPSLAFKSKVAISGDELKVIPWPANKREGSRLLDRLDSDPVTKDRMAWLCWNVPGDVEVWNSEQIKFTPRYEFIKSCTEKGKCYEMDETLKPRQGKNK